MISLEDLENQKPLIGFDSKPLNGLRGFVAIHLVIFHSIWYSEYNINIYGSAQMPLFFLLSGFSMTLGYGKKKFTCSTICCGPCKTTLNCCICCTCRNNCCCLCCCCKNINEEGQEDDGDVQIEFDSWNFYKNRFTRILPVYYATFLFSLPLIFLGHNFGISPYNYGATIGGGILAILLQQTVLMSEFGFGPDGPSWTVSTLFFFYWFYPSLLVFCQRQSNQRLVLFMVLAFYFESSLGTFLFLILQEVGANEGAYWISTAHPISRIPVFFMGVCAGVLCMRIKEQDYEALNCFGRFSNNGLLSFIEDVFFPNPCASKKSAIEITTNEKYVKEKQKTWARRVNLNAGYYFLLLLALSILNAVYTIDLINDNIANKEECKNSTLDIIDYGKCILEEGDDKEKSVDYQIFKWALPSIFGQFYFCYVQLMIIVGLCLDGGQSIFAKFFNTKPLQFLGRISMAIYLVHEPAIFWITCAIYGPDLMPLEDKVRGFRLPLWAVPIHVIISIVLGVILTLYVEDPARKNLTKWWKVKKI